MQLFQSHDPLTDKGLFTTLECMIQSNAINSTLIK